MSDIPRAELGQFLERLDDEVGYAVAKQPDLWANLQRGGDWDLVVGDLGRAQAALVATVGRPMRTVRRSYVVAHFFAWGEIDLLPGLEWRGVELASAEAVIAGARRVADGWPIARLAHQAVAGWVYQLLAYGSPADRYVQVAHRAALEDADELESILERLFGVDAPALLVAARSRELEAVRPLLPALRRAAHRRALAGRPVATLRAMSAFVRAELALRIPSPIASAQR